MAGLPPGGQLNIGPEKTVTTRVGILFNLKTVKSQGIYSVKCQFRGSLKGGNATFFTVFPFYKGDYQHWRIEVKIRVT